MTRRLALAVVGCALGTLLAVSLAPAHAQHHASTSRVVLASQSCKHGVQRPKVLVFACADFGWYADHLRWPRWGGRIARGHGIEHLNDCTPNCAQGHFHASNVHVLLWKRRKCPTDPRLYYQKATLVHSDGRREHAVVGCPSIPG